MVLTIEKTGPVTKATIVSRLSTWHETNSDNRLEADELLLAYQRQAPAWE
jgi:hypothetical protein